MFADSGVDYCLEMYVKLTTLGVLNYLFTNRTGGGIDWRVGTGNNLELITFNYKWDDEGAPLYTGVMVDEVRELRPWALGPVVSGVQTVDYSKLEQRT